MKSILVVTVCAALALFAATARAKERPVQTFKSSAGPIKIRLVYHASLEIEAGGKVIVVDPAKPAVFAGLPQADLILITDIHGDHLDPSLIAAESKPGTEIIAPPAVVKTVTTASPISNGEKKTWGAWTIEAVPMYNLTRGPEGGKLYHDKGRGNGYILTYRGTGLYLSRDNERIPEIRAVNNIGIAILLLYLDYTIT